MRGEKYLSGIAKLRLAEYRVVLRDAYNKYFPNLFPIEVIGEDVVNNVLGEAMRRGDHGIGEMSLDYFHLRHRCSQLDMKANPVLIG